MMASKRLLAEAVVLLTRKDIARYEQIICMNYDFVYPRISERLTVQKVSSEKVTVFVETTKKSYVIKELEYKLLLEMDGSKNSKQLSKISKVYNEQQILELIKVFDKIGFLSNGTKKDNKKLFVREGLIRFKVKLISGNKLFSSDSWFVKVAACIILYLSLPVFVCGLVRFYLTSEHFANVNVDILTSTPLYVYLLLFFAIVAVHELGHAIVTRNLHIPVSEIGLVFYLIYPIFYTNISFSRLLTRRIDRLKCLIGGICTNFLFAGISLFICDQNISSQFFCILLCNVMLNMLIIATNLVVFFKLDGYFMLQDMLEIPYLYENSVKHVTELIWSPFLKFRASRTKKEQLQISDLKKSVTYEIEDSEKKNSELYAVFGLLCMLYVPVMVLSIVLLFVRG